MSEKIRSVAEFHNTYLLKNLQNKLAVVSEKYQDPDSKEQVEYNIDLIRKELLKEADGREVFKEYCEDVRTGKKKIIDQFHYGQVNDQMIEELEEYIKDLSDMYSDIYRDAFRASDQIKQQFDLEDLQELQRKHHNKTLADFVINKNEFEKIDEYKGQLIQKGSPIYLDPSSKFIKAHFYAPRKMIFGKFIPTIWANVIVIWFMTIMLYILLYFRVLKRFLDMMENMTRKK